MKTRLKSFVTTITIGIALSVSALSAQSAPIEVDLELALAIDVSGSINTTDFNLQRTGYQTAFSNSSLQNDMLAGSYGQIAINVIFFGSNATQWSNGWQLIDSHAAADNVSSLLGAMVRPESGGTHISAGIDAAAASFGTDYLGTRQVIDVSGDGNQNRGGCFEGQMNCQPLQQARDAFLANRENRAINAIWINDRHFFGNTGTENVDSLEYGNTNVIGGNNSFQLAISSFQDFEQAIANKLEAEFRDVTPTPTPVPEPGTLAIMILGLVGLGARRAVQPA